MVSLNLNDIAILNIHVVILPYIINGINKSEAVNFLQNANLSKKKWIILTYNFSLSCIKDE